MFQDGSNKNILSTSQSVGILAHRTWTHCTLGVEQGFHTIMPRWPAARSPESGQDYLCQSRKPPQQISEKNKDFVELPTQVDLSIEKHHYLPLPTLADPYGANTRLPHGQRQSQHNELVSFASLLAISRTFNSLSKVLFTFPSRYLFAIGLESIFSFR